MNLSYNKIAAVTVTYNDFNYLKKAISALKEQTYPVQKIIVVDNNSTYENKLLLSREKDDIVEILWLPENRGGAGGFEAGMRYAHEKYNPDWYWLMDADAYPQCNCLETLLSHSEDCKNIGILAPLIFGVDLCQYQLYHIKNVSKFLYRDLLLYSSADEIPSGTSNIETDAFVGPLIAKNAVEKLGYADGELFIYGDDHEYTYRVSRKFDVLLVKEAIINHRDQPVNGRQHPENWWKDYYAFRNRVLFIKKYKSNTAQSIIGTSLLLLRVVKQIIIILLSKYNFSTKKARIKTLMKAISDGVKEISGKTIEPSEYKEYIKSINS